MGRGDRCGGERLEREVAVGDAVERVGRRPVEAERVGRHLPVDRKGCSGERRGAERAFVETLPRVPETPRVARQHFDVSQEMVAESDGLRRLQMGEAWHHHAGAVERARGQRALQAVI